MFQLIKLFQVASEPWNHSEEEIKKALVQSKILCIFGYVFSLLMIGCMWFSYKDYILDKKPERPSVSVENFSPENLSGSLSEAFIRGFLHLDKVEFVIPKSVTKYGQHPRSLIPITGAKWQENDPVSIYLHSGWLLSSATDNDLKLMLDREGLPVKTADIVEIDKLVMRSDKMGDSLNTNEWLTSHGLLVTSDVQVVEIIEGERNDIYSKRNRGTIGLAKILALFSVVCLLIGKLSKYGVQRTKPVTVE
ncbi:hypothetical protein IMCC1989_290 [gamma proteobacterium IMCC1989]|nr:hypothetical protein IMCC1989_290 [gamma proteobacterium IMCC1989]